MRWKAGSQNLAVPARWRAKCGQILPLVPSLFANATPAFCLPTATRPWSLNKNRCSSLFHYPRVLMASPPCGIRHTAAARPATHFTYRAPPRPNIQPGRGDPCTFAPFGSVAPGLLQPMHGGRLFSARKTHCVQPTNHRASTESAYRSLGCPHLEPVQPVLFVQD